MRRTLRVLVVDDDPTIRDVLQTMVSFDGWEVVTAPDGESGLLEAALLSPDLVLLEAALPGMDGLEVCRRLKAGPRPPRVVMVSTRTGPEDRERGLRAGADAYVAKPFSALELLSIVDADDLGVAV